MELIEREVERTTYRIDVQCSFCKKGYMIYTGKGRNAPVLIPNQKPKLLYLHACSHCKAEMSFEIKYPYYKENLKVMKEDNNART